MTSRDILALQEATSESLIRALVEARRKVWEKRHKRTPKDFVPPAKCLADIALVNGPEYRSAGMFLRQGKSWIISKTDPFRTQEYT